MIGLSNGRDAGFGRRAGPARQAVQWWTSPSGRRTRVRGPVENDASMEIRKQRGFPQAPRLRRISHRPDGGNASPSTCFQAAAIHLQIGNLLSEEWGHPQGLSLYSILATAKIGPLQQAPTGTKAHHQAPLSRLMFLLENAGRNHRSHPVSPSGCPVRNRAGRARCRPRSRRFRPVPVNAVGNRRRSPGSGFGPPRDRPGSDRS